MEDAKLDNSGTGMKRILHKEYLRLREGAEVLSKDNFGGWGFIFDSNKKLFSVTNVDEELKTEWCTPQGDLNPESAVYDSKNNVIYYSNFDNRYNRHKLPSGYITKANIQGEVLELKWIDSLYAPSGICLHDDKLYIVERNSLSIFSTINRKLIKRCYFPENMRFANDAIVDDMGNVYITNTAPQLGATDIFIFKDDKIESWIISDELSSLNGIFLDGQSLIVGNSGKNKLQRVNIKTKKISTIVSLGSGVIDGIRKDKNGNLFVSLWKGELYKINKSGEIIRLLNSVGEFNIADFEYIKENDLLIVPTFLGRNIMAFKCK